jgi:hypothetical protein
MTTKTWGQLKWKLAETAGATGMASTDGRLVDLVNAAVEELMDEGDWPGVVDRWKVRWDKKSGEVVLPSFLDRILGVTVDDRPLEMRSPWFEFVQYGPGNLRDDEVDEYGNARPGRRQWSDVVVDRGVSATPQDLPEDGGPWQIQSVAVADETNGGGVSVPSITINGLDGNGREVRTYAGGVMGVWTTGAKFPMNGISTQSFSKITEIVKPVTNGSIILTATNGVVSGIAVGELGWNETTPQYRRYYIPALWSDTQGVKDRVLIARCRRKFVAIIGDDNEVPIISDVTALQEMMVGQYKRLIGEVPEATTHVAAAIARMKKLSVAHSGKSKVPGLAFTKGFNIGTVPSLR